MVKAVPIVVVAYNRPRSLSRILGSLANANYDRSDVPLIISIDKGDNADVLKIAEAFEWTHGPKIVNYQKENLKLRKHILKCGDYAKEYGNVIILEDDLYVSPYFYEYTISALKFSENREYIGGISLYNHRYNVVASEPFEPMDDGFDNWYFQFASSWGQAWSEKQWRGFKQWYDAGQRIDTMAGLPQYVKNWPASSWLKYFIAYLVASGKYFLYPRKSLTTNFGDAGTHVRMDNTNFQVPLQMAPVAYHFSDLAQSQSIYDAYYESTVLRRKYCGKNCVVDLYGTKPWSEIADGDYLLSRKALKYEVIAQYGCCMRPHEANILQAIAGSDFFVYDLTKKTASKPSCDNVRKVQYNLRYIHNSQYGAVLKMFYRKTLMGIGKRLKRKRN